MLKWVAGAMAAFSLLLASSQASAQKLETPDQPLAVRVGAIWPSNHALRSATDSAWLDLGLDYIVGTTSAGNDWVGSLDFGTSSHINYWALQAIYMWRNQNGTVDTHGFSYGFGAGVYFLDPDQGDRTTEFGVPVVFDWNLNHSVFVEGKYHWVVTNTQADALSVQLGYRF